MVSYFHVFIFLIITENSLCNFLKSSFEHATRQTLFEMEVEDKNSVHKMSDHLVRRLIVLPLTEAFNPCQVYFDCSTSAVHISNQFSYLQASGMHGKVQYGDKCSLPASIGRLIFEKPYEVPWIFEVIPDRTITKAFSSELQDRQFVKNDLVSKKYGIGKVLDKAFMSPLDFRSPENYVFLPRWLMKSLGPSYIVYYS